MMKRQEVFSYVKDKFDTIPDYPWPKSPEHAVLRHSNSGKWYGLVMKVPKDKLGLSGDDIIDILNLKCDPTLNSILRGQDGILPAYHMNKEHWISIVLNSTFSKGDICNLIDQSYDLTKPKMKK